MTTEPSPRDVIARIILGGADPIDHTGSSVPIVRAVHATDRLLAAIDTDPAVADALITGHTDAILTALTRAGVLDVETSPGLLVLDGWSPGDGPARRLVTPWREAT